MRRFFRFSIRDLLWLTLVVALSLGWWIDRHQLGEQLRARATKWREAAGALEHALVEDGCQVDWTTFSSTSSTAGVCVVRQKRPRLKVWTVDLGSFAPSLPDD